MALSHDVLSQTFSVVWIFALCLTESVSKKTAVYYMDGSDCDVAKYLGGATVYSHQSRHQPSSHYGDNIECRITFRAENEGWKLMLRTLELDIPDRAPYAPYLCKDALYVYNTDSIIGTPMKEAGGNAGLCGKKLPPVLYSTGPYLTIYFRSDRDGKRGRGFKLVITAFNDDYKEHRTCGANFLCDNSYCIDEDLKCDSVDHCGDQSDEAGITGARCDIKGQANLDEDNILTKFLSLGVTATIAISVGSIVVFVVCLSSVVCCCLRYVRPRNQDGVASATTTPTHVLMTNGQSQHQAVKVKSSEYLIQSEPVYQPMFTHQGYHPMHTVYTNTTPSTQYSPFISQRDYTPTQAPPSYHRSFTPTSSRSAKSARSNGSSSVTYHTNHDKVVFPVSV